VIAGGGTDWAESSPVVPVIHAWHAIVPSSSVGSLENAETDSGLGVGNDKRIWRVRCQLCLNLLQTQRQV
jgi:hypothetical protein